MPFFCVLLVLKYEKGGSPVNARTCKHLKAFLGEKYENARIKMKNPHGPPPKGGKAKPASKPKTPVKRKKRDADEDEEEEEAKPAKRGRKAAAASKPQSKGKAKKGDDDDEEAEDGEDLEDVEDEDAEPSTSGKSVPELLLANKWDIEKGLDPTGWWVSEKLDGVRCVQNSPYYC